MIEDSSQLTLEISQWSSLLAVVTHQLGLPILVGVREDEEGLLVVGAVAVAIPSPLGIVKKFNAQAAYRLDGLTFDAAGDAWGLARHIVTTLHEACMVGLLHQEEFLDALRTASQHARPQIYTGEGNGNGEA